MFQPDGVDLVEDAVADKLAEAQLRRAPRAAHLRDDIRRGDPPAGVPPDVLDRRRHPDVMPPIAEGRGAAADAQDAERGVHDTPRRIREETVQQLGRHRARPSEVGDDTRQRRNGTVAKGPVVIDAKDGHVARDLNPTFQEKRENSGIA